ncbi:MAG: 50S ribosomal protein L22 [Actinomycetota bacterium]
MEAKATLRYARVAPSKVRHVAQNIRELPVDEAQRLLLLETKAVARDLRKILDSAVANAEHNHDLDADDLYVADVIVNEGPILKRFRPRAMGRATRINKRTSHITVVVAEAVEEPAAAARTAEPASDEE